MKSIGAMVQQIEALAGTKDVSAWETKFITDMVNLTHGGTRTLAVSPKQASVIERIYKKHFGDADGE